jgi:hypothetical protein
MNEIDSNTVSKVEMPENFRTPHHDFVNRQDVQEMITPLINVQDSNIDQLISVHNSRSIELMQKVYNKYTTFCLKRNIQTDPFILPDEIITGIRIKRLGILLSILFPLLKQNISNLEEEECAIAILYYYFSINHSDQTGYDSANIVKSYNGFNPNTTWNDIFKKLESNTKKTKYKISQEITNFKQMQKNVDECIIQFAFLDSSHSFSNFILTTNGGGKNRRKQSNKKKSKKNKTRRYKKYK